VRKALFLLGALDDGDIDWLISVGRRDRVPAGATLIHEGKEVECVFIVLDGTLAVRISAADKEIARLRVGEIVGEMSFVDARPPSASVVALEDSMVLSIPRGVLSERLKKPEFAARFYRALAIFLANRLRNTVAQLGYGRVAPGVDRVEPDDEVGPTALESLVVAGARFDWMLRRLRGQ